jgi:NitT/TauT family transport system substrate-binding protein
MIRRSDFLYGLSAAGVLGLEAANPPAGKLEKPNLKIGLPVEATSFLPVYVAQAKTWAPQGLDVQLLSFRGDAEVAQALAGDSTDINVASPNGLINMINAGQPVIGFYAGFWQSDFAWLGAPSVKRWEDLKGKTVGVSTFGSLTDALTRYALRKHKLEPEKDVQIVQAGGTPSAYQALKAGRISAAILSPPFKWQGPEEGLNVLGTESKDVAPQWPKHVFLTKTKFLRENPNTIAAVLRAHVAAIRLAKAQRDVAVGVMVDRLKYQKQWAERAYDDVINDFNERGTLPDKYMPVFWQITMSLGDVKEPWPDSKLLDRHYIDTFKQWAPA